MELVKGVNLQFLSIKKIKTIVIKVRFSSPLDENTVAARVLVACMMETANQNIQLCHYSVKKKIEGDS